MQNEYAPFGGCTEILYRCMVLGKSEDAVFYNHLNRLHESGKSLRRHFGGMDMGNVAEAARTLGVVSNNDANLLKSNHGYNAKTIFADITLEIIKKDGEWDSQDYTLAQELRMCVDPAFREKSIEFYESHIRPYVK